MTPTAKECAIHGVTEEIKYFISIVGIGFHPDTSFHKYVWIAKGGKLPCFKMKEANRLDIRLDECHDMCDKYDIDIYQIALSIVKPLTEVE